MIAHLRILLLCALLLLSWQSVSTSASASSADVAASDATAQPEMFYKVDPREDSTVYEIPFVQANFDVPITPHTQPLTPIASRRPDSMEGAVDSFNRASDVRPTEDGVAEEEAVDHTMRPLQAGSQFTMQRRTSMAPWSPRIQPGLMYRSREITYTQAKTGLRVRLGAGYLLMYEGGMTNRTGVVTYSIENDVWISNDDGITWDLIAGRSEYGPSGPTSSPNNNGVTFDARSGSNNCNDPASDLIISLGGNNATTLSSTSSTYYSYTGVNWQLNNPLTTPTWAPIRHFSSCDITERGDVMLIGGHFHINTNNPADYLLNDVWRGTGALDSAYQLVWRPQTTAAPFAAREEHLVLVGYSSFWKTEIIYVIGGRVTCTNANCYDGVMANDVWASSDYGITWAALNANAPFSPRWGHGGWITREGVLLVWGGLNTPTGLYDNTITQRDIWASFDGGFTWSQCATADTAWIRGEQGIAVNANGQLVLVAGYAYQENGQFQARYNDVWRSDFNVENTANLADRCGGGVPAAGPGLRRWPGVGATPANTLTFTPATMRAPWSPRYKAGLLLMSTPLSYKTVDGTTANTGPNWLLMYEGMGLVSSIATSNENDVYASADNGHSWTMIAGNSQRGQRGSITSAYPDTSFSGSISSANCEDPTTDDVYSIGGLRWNSGFWSTNDVWYSSNALWWNHTSTMSTRLFDPPREGATCDVGHSRNIILIGGAWSRPENGTRQMTLYNDVWQSTNKGLVWTRVTQRAQFMARRDHAMQITFSDYYGKDLVYLVGGRGMVNNVADSFNDVWVSSNGGAMWRNVAVRAQFSKRFETSVVVTSQGAMLLIGGRGQTDIWASMNGGVKWTACRVLGGNQSVSDSSAITLTADDRLVIASGSPRADVILGDQSLTQAAVLARHCQTTVPAEGVGLRVDGWDGTTGSNSGGNGTDPDSGNTTSDTSSSGGTLSGMAIVGIVAAVLVALAAAYGYWRWQQKNSLASSTGDPSGLLGTDHGTVEGQVHGSNSLDSSLLADTDGGHSSL